MRIVTVVALGVTVITVAAACGGTETASDTSEAVAAETVAEERPGNPVVYERIAVMTDCAELQGEFDTADRNREARSGTELAAWSLSYMKAADHRMRAIGCYG